MRLTDAELAALPEKARRQPEIVDLYRRHEFLVAYALHTDARVEVDGYCGAIGAVGDWEKYGDLSLAMLQAQGLQRHHWLLDFGCGTGRLARKAAPYVDLGFYYGVDISERALREARELSKREGWFIHAPLFVNPALAIVEMHVASRRFDFAWAFSVGIHLPIEHVRQMFDYVRSWLATGGVFLCSYVPEQRDERTGLKQFRHTERSFVGAAEAAGFTKFSDVTDQWGGAQRIGRFEF